MLQKYCSKLHALGLERELLHCQGYDGFGSIVDIRNRANSIIMGKYPLVTFVHCNSHISIASSCSGSIMMATVSEVWTFFSHAKPRQD